MKEYKGFAPKFYLDAETNLIRGQVVNTRDTITFHGKTVEEAWDAFRESVDDYLAFCGELGVEPEKPFNGKILLRITPATHRRLTLLAQRKRTSVNSLIRREINNAVKRGTPTGGARF